MIYAKLDVDIIDHPKAIKAGSAARDLWVWGILYARKHQTDGVLEMDVVLASTWGHGGKANIKAAERLVLVGLWERIDAGFRVLRYAEKNDTKAAIDERRREVRERVAAHRKKRVTDPLCNALLTQEVTPVTSALVPGSGSGSDSGFVKSREGELERETDPPEQEPAKFRYRRAYCAGVGKAKGSPYVWPPAPKDAWADKDLGYAITHFATSDKDGRAYRGDELLEWISAAAADFVEHVIEAKEDPKYWSGFAPKGLIRFLSQEVRAEEARHVG